MQAICIEFSFLFIIRVLIKYWQPAKKKGHLEVWAIYFLGKKNVKWDSESLKLPTALNYQTASFHILAVYFKIQWEPSLLLLFILFF